MIFGKIAFLGIDYNSDKLSRWKHTSTMFIGTKSDGRRIKT